jgi:hypothetical protein
MVGSASNGEKYPYASQPRELAGSLLSARCDRKRSAIVASKARESRKKRKMLWCPSSFYQYIVTQQLRGRNRAEKAFMANKLGPRKLKLFRDAVIGITH